MTSHRTLTDPAPPQELVQNDGHQPLGTDVGASSPTTTGTQPDTEKVEPDPPGDPTGRVRDVLDTLATTPNHDARGQFVHGNTAAGKTLERSAALWQFIEPAKQDLIEQINRDQAIDADSTTVLRGLIDAYAEVRLFRASLFVRMTELGGAVTTKGKARALYRSYLSAVDRELRLADVIGKERKQKRMQSLGEMLSVDR